MNILDVFNSNAFGVISLTGKVNLIQNRFGLVTRMGIFRESGVSNRVVAVDFDQSTNTILPARPWGAPGTANKGAKPYTKSFAIPHFPLEDAIMAEDLQGVRVPGGDQVITAEQLMQRKLEEMRGKLDQTREWLMLGAIKGTITDGLNNTVLALYTDFGVAQQTNSFELDQSGTDVLAECSEVIRLINAELLGEITTGFVGLCSDGFYDAFTAHTSVRDAYKYYQVNGRNLASDQLLPFTFGGIQWVNYSGVVTDAGGTSRAMIGTDEAYILPLGTSVFQMWNAPADYIETVNTLGLPYYAKQEPMKFGKGIAVEMQTNPLPICLKPRVIVKATKT